MTRRILTILFPWYVLWRIHQLSDVDLFDNGHTDEWSRGYDRAMYEVRFNLGMERLP